MKHKTFTVDEAMTLSRFFAALARQVNKEIALGDFDNGLRIANLSGVLQSRVFSVAVLADGTETFWPCDCLFDRPIEMTEAA